MIFLITHIYLKGLGYNLPPWLLATWWENHFPLMVSRSSHGTKCDLGAPVHSDPLCSWLCGSMYWIMCSFLIWTNSCHSVFILSVIAYSWVLQRNRTCWIHTDIQKKTCYATLGRMNMCIQKSYHCLTASQSSRKAIIPRMNKNTILWNLKLERRQMCVPEQREQVFPSLTFVILWGPLID